MTKRVVSFHTYLVERKDSVPFLQDNPDLPDEFTSINELIIEAHFKNKDCIVCFIDGFPVYIKPHEILLGVTEDKDGWRCLEVIPNLAMGEVYVLTKRGKIDLYFTYKYQEHCIRALVSHPRRVRHNKSSYLLALENTKQIFNISDQKVKQILKHHKRLTVLDDLALIHSENLGLEVLEKLLNQDNRVTPEYFLDKLKLSPDEMNKVLNTYIEILK